MVINKGVILSNLASNIINLLLILEYQESFFNVEVFFLNVSRHRDIIVVLISNKKELLNEGRRRRKSNELKNCFEAAVNLSLESWIVILNDAKVRMSYPSIDELLIKLLCLLQILVSSFVVSLSIEL